MKHVVESFAYPDALAILVLALGPVLAIYLRLYFPSIVSVDIRRLRGVITFGILLMTILSGCAASWKYFEARADALQPSVANLLVAIDYAGALLVWSAVASLPGWYALHIGFSRTERLVRDFKGSMSLSDNIVAWVVFTLVILPGILISWALVSTTWLAQVLFGFALKATEVEAIGLGPIIDRTYGIRFTVILERLLHSIEEQALPIAFITFLSAVLAIIAHLIAISRHIKATESNDEQDDDRLRPPP